MLTLGKSEPVTLDSIGHAIAEAFHEASGGVPNLLGLVIRDLYESPEGVAMDADGRWRALCDIDSLRRSHSAEKVVRDRLDRVEPGIRATLEAAAVIGVEIDVELLHRVGGRSTDELDGHLETAMSRHFIQADDGAVRFETDATRRAIYRAIPASRRADVHEAVAAALRERASDGNTLMPDVQIGRHLSEVAKTRDGQAADTAANHFILAADRAVATEPLDAVNLAHDALALLDKYELDDDPQLRRAAQDVVASAQERLGRPTSEESQHLAAGLRGQPS